MRTIRERFDPKLNTSSTQPVLRFDDTIADRRRNAIRDTCNGSALGGPCSHQTRRITGRPLAFWMRTTSGATSPASASVRNRLIAGDSTRNNKSPRCFCTTRGRPLVIGGRRGNRIKFHFRRLALANKKLVVFFGRQIHNDQPVGRRPFWRPQEVITPLDGK